MTRGGRRPGAGRKAGSVNQISQRAREQASKTGELPHEFLLRVARGENIDGHEPAFPERMDAAKAAAPYFAPRLSTAAIDASITNRNKTAREMTDAELMAIAAGRAPE
jgi:hypothetical protein